MDNKPREPHPDDLRCPYCNPEGRELVGATEERRQRRLKCRKCDAEYWGNEATGMVQLEDDD